MTENEAIVIEEAIRLVKFKGLTRDFPIAPLCNAVSKVERERRKKK